MARRDGADRLLLTAVALAVVLEPRWLDRGPTLCLVRRLTGRRCPGCGMSRSWTLMARLRPLAAFRAHPLGPDAFAAATLAVLRAAGRS